MAVESHGFASSASGRSFVDRRRRSWWGALQYQSATAVREAYPWLLSALVVTTPFVAYAIGQARLNAAMNRRTALLRQIRNDRVEITQLRDQLREILAPGVLARWADARGMQPANDVVTIGMPASPSQTPAVGGQRRTALAGTSDSADAGGPVPSP